MSRWLFGPGCGTLLAGALLSLARPTAAQTSAPAPTQTPAPAPAPAPIPNEPPPPKRHPLAVPAAVVPGFVLHGSGQLVLGETRPARDLMIMEGVGLAMAVVGGATIFLTGASRYFIAPAITVGLAGGGMFMSSYFADIYGAAATDSGAVPARLRAPSAWETELGYRHVYDPQYAYRDFLVQRVSSQLGAFRLSPSAWFSTRGDTARYTLESQYRVLGATGLQTPVDASFLDITLAFNHERHQTDRFTSGTAELSIDTRYDMGRIGRTMRGSFMELSAGYALGRIDYNATGIDVPSDFEQLLLGRFGFGFILRGLSAPGSEVVAFYDHRHDGYAAGIKLPGIPAGSLGHLGLDARWFFDDRFGLAAEGRVGSAYIGGISLLFRPSGVPPRSPQEQRP